MTAMRVMPTSEVFHVDDTKPNFGAGATKQDRDRDKTVGSKQSSIEVAFAECDSLGAEREKKCQDICVETERKVIEFSEEPACSTERQEDIRVMTVPGDSSRSIESPRAQEPREHRENTRETVGREKLRGNRLERGRKSVDRKQHCGDRGAVETKGEKRGGGGSSWWKDGGKTILQFFAKILGKRGGMDAKEATNRVSPGGNKRHGRHAKRVSRDDGSRKARRRAGVDAGVRLKKVSNGYIVIHAYRNGSRRKNAAENKSRQQRRQREEPRSSILRQIQRTRDKNLRVALLEQELRSRLPFAKNVASADQVPRLGQLSSPLC